MKVHTHYKCSVCQGYLDLKKHRTKKSHFLESILFFVFPKTENEQLNYIYKAIKSCPTEKKPRKQEIKLSQNKEILSDEDVMPHDSSEEISSEEEDEDREHSPDEEEEENFFLSDNLKDDIN